MTASIVKPTASPESSVRNAARDLGKADRDNTTAQAATLTAWKAAGEETPALRAAFLTGYLAGALGVSISIAEKILAKSGATSKGKATVRRTESQETAYTAARKALSRLRKAADVKPADKRGGQAGRIKKPAPAKAATKAPATTIPTLVGPRDLAAFLLALANKNAPAFQKQSGKDLVRAIHAFVTEHKEAKA